MAQIYVTDEVQKGLVIAPTLNMSSTTAKNVTWFKRELTSKQMFDNNLIMDPMPNDKGELLRISGSELTPDNQVVNTFGYRYVVDQEDIEASPEPFMVDIQDMCYGIAKAIETDIVAKLIAAAVESTATVVGGTWDQSTQIAECLRGFKAEYRKRSINGMLDVLFEDSDNYDALGSYIVNTEGINNIVEEDNVITYGGLQNTWAAEGLVDGTVLGFCSKLPPASVVYRKIAGAYAPVATKPGTEQYVPIINMKVIDSDGEGMDPVRDFRFGASWAVPITRPASIFYKTGV